MNPSEHPRSPIRVTLLTGGGDRPYVFGLTKALTAGGITIDLICGDELDEPEFRDNPDVDFLNLRGSQDPSVGFFTKLSRISGYYVKLLKYATTAKPKLFHILWNNRFEAFDRTLLMLYYRALRKKIILTAHNVNAAKREGTDSWFNRITLGAQYRLAHHIFVHTDKMRQELGAAFKIPDARTTVIPFGINNSVPTTALTATAAKQRLGVGAAEKTILFFGRITPYKGLEYLIGAFREVLRQDKSYRLIIAGRPDNCDKYWREINDDLSTDVEAGRVLLRAEFISDKDTEIYFKAADVLVLPYRDIYQSGVLFLAHSFGLPVLAADVGSLSDDVVEGHTGFVFSPENPAALAVTIDKYFGSDLYADLVNQRANIRRYTSERHSWEIVEQETIRVYAALLDLPGFEQTPNCTDSGVPLDIKALS